MLRSAGERNSPCSCGVVPRGVIPSEGPGCNTEPKNLAAGIGEPSASMVRAGSWSGEEQQRDPSTPARLGTGGLPVGMTRLGAEWPGADGQSNLRY
ncbi:MAG TPA: hypothetical protein VKA68_01470 [bacterium]|nr:hypothetical protein [bacterium]